MSNSLDQFVWERAAKDGHGTSLTAFDSDFAQILNSVIPDCDLGQMACHGEAVATNSGRYFLTTEGFHKFMVSAEQQGDPKTIDILRRKEQEYWFRSYDEWLAHAGHIQKLLNHS